MFINEHDLTLATILLLFAAGIAMALGYFLSATLTENIAALGIGAHRIAAGHLDTRVRLGGNDEISELASSFNEMAVQLETAARKQSELDALRRELIAWVGHDLRTPLASVRAIVEALADGVVDDPATVDRYLSTAKRDIASLSMLIDDLFDMAQLDAGGMQLDRQMNSMTDLISDTIESFTGVAASKQVSLSGEAAPGIDPVPMDARLIGRVLGNLVGNAVRHTPEGGAVSVAAVPIPGAVRIDIADTGEGIRSEDLPHVFEQFYRGEKSRSRATGGSGLGLAISKGIVEAHGGAISVRTAQGKGTTVSFTLPAKPLKDPRRSGPGARVFNQRLGGKMQPRRQT